VYDLGHNFVEYISALRDLLGQSLFVYFSLSGVLIRSGLDQIPTGYVLGRETLAAAKLSDSEYKLIKKAEPEFAFHLLCTC
jgi:hypothetical protein